MAPKTSSSIIIFVLYRVMSCELHVGMCTKIVSMGTEYNCAVNFPCNSGQYFVTCYFLYFRSFNFSMMMLFSMQYPYSRAVSTHRTVQGLSLT